MRDAACPGRLCAEPFVSRRLCDVGLSMRRRASLGPLAALDPLHRVVHELPLTCRVDVHGSEVCAHDLRRALFGLVRIRRHYAGLGT